MNSERASGRWEQQKAQGRRESGTAENDPNPAVGSQNESQREEPRKPKERKPILDEGPPPQEREWWAKQTGRTEIEEAWARGHAGRMERRRRAELKREIEREVMSRWREKKRKTREEQHKRRDVQRLERERLERERRESERNERERLEREAEALERQREEEELNRVEREREAREACERTAERERLERERKAAEWKSGLYRFLPGKTKEESDNICFGVKILLGILLIMVVGAFLGDWLNS